MTRFAICLAAALLPLFGQTPPPVSPEALRVEVSYLASDYLKGRNTPSPELDVAAEFIASQFQRAGLAPAGNDGYFQFATLSESTPNDEGFQLSLNGIELPFDLVRVTTAAAVDVKAASVRKITPGGVAQLKELATAAGIVFLAELPDFRAAGTDRAATMAAFAELRKETARLKPAALILVSRQNGHAPRRATLAPAGEAPPAFPVLTVFDATGKLFESLPADARATLRMAAPHVRPSTVRNVIGVLRGSDPVLRGTYVVVSAHYDHLGVSANTEGDRIFNGANDDASGTASVIEVATALARAKPKRSVLCMAFFGEEKGLLGASYYVQHPLFPIGKTVANINLEQMGRTDDSEGPLIGRANLTGFDYSNIGKVFADAGKPLGIDFFKRDANSDQYFRSSDNFPFAEAGVPAHTVSVSYMFPDYHQPGDEWPKLDYENMARVDRAVAAGVLALANSADAPAWNADNPKAAGFAKAHSVSK
jgi:hypothetical protein